MMTHVTCEIVVSSWPTICGRASTTIDASAKASPTAKRTERSRQERLARRSWWGSGWGSVTVVTRQPDYRLAPRDRSADGDVLADRAGRGLAPGDRALADRLEPVDPEVEDRADEQQDLTQHLGDLALELGGHEPPPRAQDPGAPLAPRPPGR